MKPLALTCLLLVGATMNARSEGEPLESVQRARWVHRDYENPKYGISVSVRARPEIEKKGTSWGSGTFDKIEVNGTKVSLSIQEDDEQIAEIRVPLDLETISYLFTAKNEPDYVRFIAASRIKDSNLPPGEQLKLLQRGVALPEASLRYYIWRQICDFKPRAEVSELLHLGLRDSCIDIAHGCLGEIIEHHGLRRADGSEIPLTTFWRSRVHSYYIVRHREIYEVAKALRGKRPDLVPRAELEKIRDRAMPTDEWFEHLYENKDTRARDFFREYAAKAMAEQVGADPVSPKPDGTGR